MLPTKKLVVEFDPEQLAELAAVQLQALAFYPDAPPLELLQDIERREEALNAAANEQILAFGAQLVTEGERPWFEVWYPYDAQIDPEGDGTSTIWDRTGDAVEVFPDGTIVTLPPYSEMRA